MITITTAPEIYRQAGHGFTSQAADRVPIGALALVDGKDVMWVAAYTDATAHLMDSAGWAVRAPAGTVRPIAGSDDRHQFDLGAGFGAWLRTGEILLRFNAHDGWLCSGQDKTCRKPLATIVCCWDHRITDPMYRTGEWMIGEDSFEHLRHADGSPCGEPRQAYAGWLEITDSWPIPRCPACKTYESLQTRQEAYGDRTWCTTTGCTYTRWYSIGD